MTGGGKKQRESGARSLHAAVAGAFLLLAAPAGAQERWEFRELHMGMEVRLVMYASGESAARAAARAAFDRVAQLDAMMSDYRAESELRRLEVSGGGMRVSPELFHVLSVAVGIAREADGAFDPTAGALVRLWREARRTRRVPDARTLDSARALTGWRGLVFDSAGSGVTLARSGMRLDLGGVAKGYIIGEALHALRARGAPRAMVEAGGDIVVGDAPPGQVGWRIVTPYADSAVTAAAGSLTNASVSTSGPSAQFVEIDGVRHSHVVDPRSGRPLTSAVHVTVIARDGALADALATALTVLAPAERERLMATYRPFVVTWSATEARPKGTRPSHLEH